ncbi:hypothetical protein AW27_023385 [Streptomyces sp. PCS3-D2]|uniref:hypothetical protein n=1 Tax=Streptomyces sp. PCS3-D2 TaxID=1460244 RepID=UPI00044E6DCF|nr:hypothetical protein [Streptomyces sp. PCS3-D2]WKV74188.1 hypothetical protein AW27_023385 [Streptomyces sp. PCS3-D2]
MARTAFPDDLLLTQVRVIQTYAALAGLCGGRTTDLRHRLLADLRDLYAHPYWAEPGHSHADLVELRRAARARAWAKAA